MKPNKITIHENYIEMEISQGQTGIFDIEDYEKIKGIRWHSQFDKGTNSFYVCGNVKINGKWKGISMARLIMNAQKYEYVDHISHDTLDNRKENLRICTNQENTLNKRKRKNNTSGFIGVYYHISNNKYESWCVSINLKSGKLKHIGIFPYTQEGAIEAAKCRDNAMVQEYGLEFVTLNFPERYK